MPHRRNLLFLSLPLILIVASFSSIANSITWSVNVQRLTTHAFMDNYPALMQTKDMKLWLIWSKEIMGNLTLYYKTSSNLGRTWSDENNLTKVLASGQAQNPSAMQAANGTIWLAWASDVPPPPPPPTPDFYMTAAPQKLTLPRGNTDTSNITIKSTNNFDETVELFIIEKPGGVNTSLNPENVTPFPGGEINSTLTVSVDLTAVPGNYTVTVVGKSSTRTHTVDIDLEITANAGGATQQSTQGKSVSMQSPQLDSYIYDFEIQFKTSNDNGATWSRDGQITENNIDDMHPSIIQLQNSTIMLAWQSYISGNSEICYKTTNGTAWSETIQLTTNPANDKTPTLTQTKNGQIWIVWASDRYGDYEIFYKIYNGSTWSSDTRLTTSIGYDVQPTIIQATNGDMYIIWSSDSGGNFDIYYQCSTDNGTTWSGRTPFAASSYQDEWPAAMRAQDTKIWVVWASDEADQPDGNWEIFIKSSLAGDVNGDGITNIADLTVVSLVYGTTEGKPNYNPNADVNRDGVVDVIDMRIVGRYFAET